MGVSAVVNAERVVLLGWSRAILLQLAHPLVAAGVYEHSSFRARPRAAIQRLRHTIRAMLALSFRGDAERERTLEGIRAIHRRVHGTLPDDVGTFSAGTPYSAEDSALLVWVHATLLESLPMFYELLVRPLSIAERDAYCMEAASVPIELGARDADVPRSWRMLQAYIHGMYDSGQIAVGPQARELAAHVLSPPLGPLRPAAAWMNRSLTLGTLPAFLREQYDDGWTHRQERSLAFLIRSVRVARRALPDVLAVWREARRPGTNRSTR